MGAGLHPSLLDCRELWLNKNWLSLQRQVKETEVLRCSSKALLEVIPTCFNKSWISFPLLFLIFIFPCCLSCCSCWASWPLLWKGGSAREGLSLGLVIWLFFLLFCLIVTPLLVLQSCITAVLFYVIFRALNSFQTPLLSYAGSESLLVFALKMCTIIRSVLCVSFSCFFFGSSGSECAMLPFRHQHKEIERFYFWTWLLGI